MLSNDLKRLKINTYSNYFLIIVKLLVSLITVPWLLAGLGEQSYGVFILAFGLLASFSFLELGAGKTVLRYVSEYRSDKDKDKFYAAIATSVSIIFYASILLFSILVIVAFFHRSLFEITDVVKRESYLSFILASFFGVIIFFQIITTNILYGFEKFLQKNIIQLFKILLLAIVSFCVYKKVFGIIGYSLFFVAIEFFSFLLELFLIRKDKAIPRLKLKILRFNVLRKSSFFKYSKEIFYVSIISTFSQNSDKFIISLFLNIKYVTIYSLVTKPFFIFKTLTNNLFSAIQPILIRQNKENKTLFKTTVIAFMQLPLIIFFPFILLAVVYIKVFFEIWLGSDFAFKDDLIWGKVALFSLIPRLLISIPNRILLLTGNTIPVKKSETIFTILNLIISLLITYLYNSIAGVVIGTFCQFTFGCLYYLKLLNKYFEVKINEIFNLQLVGFIILLSLLFLGFYMHQTFFENNFFVTITITFCLILFIQFLILRHMKLLKFIF